MIAVAWLMWQSSRPVRVSSPTPPEPGPSTASGRGIEIGVREQLPQSEPVIVSAPQNNLSKEALVALVMARLREWDDNDEPALRSQRLQELDALLNGTNILEIVQELPPNLMGYVFALPSLRQKLMSDPKAALDWMSCHTNVSGPQMLTLIHDWGQKDRKEMRQYLASMPEGDWKQSVMATASNEALSSDPVEAIVWAGQMSPGERRTGLLEMAATDWMKRDPDAAAQWVGQLNDPVLREQLLGSVMVGYADIDPVAASACVIQSVSPGEVLDQSVAGITWAWAMRDPLAAAAWVAQFPEGQTRQMALENLMNVWGNHDPTAALTWIESLPEGSLQTKAASDLLATVPSAE